MSLRIKIAEISEVVPRVKRFRLEPVSGAPLSYSPGSNLQIHLPVSGGLWNAYSLIGDVWSSRGYEIAVRREDPGRSRGGSIFLHEEACVGDEFAIRPPGNYFPLARTARRHVLIAGGIGITPFLSYIPVLMRWQVPYELHYAHRNSPAFAEELKSRPGVAVRCYDGRIGERMDVAEILSRQPAGTHVYVCGPGTLIQAVRDEAASSGWPETRIHFEQFSAAEDGSRNPFSVRLVRRERDLRVGETETLLEALERSGVVVASSCRVGGCGTCEVRVSSGAIDHRDHCLLPEERAAGRTMIACVSRSVNGRLELDL